MAAHRHHGRRPHTGLRREETPGEEVADYFALLDAGTDQAGRLYVAATG
ncbi:hypothetical protein OG613_44155 (plasmid) [Streptomyces sp. NBC_00015]